ncbi:unnamed protein product [Fraxinus pennsylvanica]|uniref:Uncharacterized protein n=1 Tax=Fraxinus pennsylvanica TaxID=56036 RepID=A0AAD1Z188_9LAMI|nr:unnamed protein product [Fraxinus pennsylvanica]
MDNSTSFQERVDTTEEAEETLSLCDFPLNFNESEKKDFSKIQDRSSSLSESSDLFEFFSDVSSDMSHAEDIIFCGKLVPYKEQHLIKDHTHNSLSIDDNSLMNFNTRSCESLSDQYTRSHKTKKLIRNSRALYYRKLSNSSLVMKSDDSEIQRSSSKSSTKSDPGSKVSKPGWSILMFGLVKFPPEMDLQDIKNRQVRRNISRSVFPAAENRVKAPARRNDRRNSWGNDLLSALSCKDYASVAVTASIDSVPQV